MPAHAEQSTTRSGQAPRVTVIMPLYNKERTVERSIASILAQTRPADEILVINDGSTDRSADLVRQHFGTRVTVIDQPNRGPGAARNRGIAEARGEVLGFLDADDEWMPEFLSRSLDILQSHGATISCVASCYVDSLNGKSAVPLWQARGVNPGPFILEPSTPPKKAEATLTYICPWATVGWTGTFRHYGGFYDQDRCLFGEDSFLFLKILLNSRVYLNMEPLVLFHREASELSANRKGPRPVEPFLTHSEAIERVCPAHLRSTLRSLLAIKAYKTACMLAYWGRWREARDLRSRFSVPRSGSTYHWLSLLGATPMGSLAGKAVRTMARR